MASATTTPQDALILLDRLLHRYHPRNFAVRLWDGTAWAVQCGGPPVFTVIIRHPAALKGILFRPNHLTLGETYIAGGFEIEGDLEEVFPVVEYLATAGLPMSDWIRYGKLVISLGSEEQEQTTANRAAILSGLHHSLQRDKTAVTHHYDRPADFFAAWLDQQMVYSCAYFADVEEDLDAAQTRKLDYICRKLRLRSGERLLDLGCGWGALILHAVRHYGVKAVGITLSEQQAGFARALVKRWGIGSHCQVEVLDYRELSEPNGYDKVVSVGMVEHVGRVRLGAYFNQVFGLLKPGGIFLNHGIGTRGKEDPTLNPFSNRYIFPDAEVVPPSEMSSAAEDAGFELRDLENLREHYVLTLQEWRRRLDANGRQVMDEMTWRMWRLYLAGTRYAFRTGRLNVYQMLFCKPDHGRSGFPLTRHDWYADSR